MSATDAGRPVADGAAALPDAALSPLRAGDFDRGLPRVRGGDAAARPRRAQRPGRACSPTPAPPGSTSATSTRRARLLARAIEHRAQRRRPPRGGDAPAQPRLRRVPRRRPARGAARRWTRPPALGVGQGRGHRAARPGAGPDRGGTAARGGRAALAAAERSFAAIGSAQDLGETEIERARVALVARRRRGRAALRRARARPVPAPRQRRAGGARPSWSLLQADLAAGRPGTGLAPPARRLREEFAAEGLRLPARTAALIARRGAAGRRRVAEAAEALTGRVWARRGAATRSPAGCTTPTSGALRRRGAAGRPAARPARPARASTSSPPTRPASAASTCAPPPPSTAAGWPSSTSRWRRRTAAASRRCSPRPSGPGPRTSRLPAGAPARRPGRRRAAGRAAAERRGAACGGAGPGRRRAAAAPTPRARARDRGADLDAAGGGDGDPAGRAGASPRPSSAGAGGRWSCTSQAGAALSAP